MLICKTCEKMCFSCAEFKKKCILADQQRKIGSGERFIWAENLRELRKYQPIEDEVTTIETVEMENQPDVIPESIEKTPNPPIHVDNHNYDFIDKLSYNQLKEMTDEVAKLLTNDFFESEQFQFIKAKVAKKSTTTVPIPVTVTSNQLFHCAKCKAKFPDQRKLRTHRWHSHNRKGFKPRRRMPAVEKKLSARE